MAIEIGLALFAVGIRRAVGPTFPLIDSSGRWAVVKGNRPDHGGPVSGISPFVSLPAQSGCDAATCRMIWIPDGSVETTSNPTRPPRPAADSHGFWIDQTRVTNRQFGAFVAATGFQTVAEIARLYDSDWRAIPQRLYAGSMVFRSHLDGVDAVAGPGWWDFVLGADWRHPGGPASDSDALPEHPVVHIAASDAEAYAAWAGKALPTEREWDRAAGQMTARHFAHDSPGSLARPVAATDRIVGTSSVDATAPNRPGMCDMAGDVWEWTSEQLTSRFPASSFLSCAPCPLIWVDCLSAHRFAGKSELEHRVLKGGSHRGGRCACGADRPARYVHPANLTASHIGFRCVRREADHLP